MLSRTLSASDVHTPSSSCARRLYSGGEGTAERDGGDNTQHHTHRNYGKHDCWHTVTASTPTEKRMVRIRRRKQTMTNSMDHLLYQHPGESEETISATVVAPLAKSCFHVKNDDADGDWSDDEEEEEDDVDICSDSESERSSASDYSMPTMVAPRSSSGSLILSNRTASYAGSERPTRERSIYGYTTGNTIQQDILARIATLKALCDEGFISQDEYERRKGAIIDELTFTRPSHDQLTVTHHGRMSIKQSNGPLIMLGLPLIVPHAPDFRGMKPEVAIKHVFNYETRQWSSKQVYITLDETPFSKGSLRVVYHLQHHDNHENSDSNHSYVAKLAIDPDEDPQTYFRDIELQAHCAYYAQLYNSYHPPKRVEFIQAWVVELTERNGALCAVESYIRGDYRKHNNNFGSVSDDERSTPQSFSHFTYEVSNHELLAVDIQGVGDLYTDPQIHTLNGNDFGKGNLGVLGFQKFLTSHRCNSICRYLKLPPVNPKDRHADAGTVPVQELMLRDRVRPTHFDSKHYYEHAPMLQKYIMKSRELEQARAKHKQQQKQRYPTSPSLIASVCRRLICCGLQ